MTDSLIEPIKVVSVFDEAIDRAKTDIAKYAGSLAQQVPGSRDIADVQFRAGFTPRFVHVRPLTMNEVMVAQRLMQQQAGAELFIFRTTVQRIEHAGGPGRDLAPHRLQRMPDGTDARLWEDEDLAQAISLFGLKFIVEMASIAWDRAQQGKAWSGSVPYMLPPWCSQELDRTAAQLAAHAREIERLDRTASSASEPPTPESPPSSAEGTDAPAKGGTSSADGDRPASQPTS